MILKFKNFELIIKQPVIIAVLAIMAACLGLDVPLVK